MKKVITLFILISMAVGIYFRYFRYIDAANNCDIRISLSLLELSNRNVIKAIKAMKYALPEEYKKVCDNVEKISPNIGCGGFQGGCYYGNPGEIYISTSQNDFLGWTAAVIAHETCHDIQNRENREFSESECYQKDNDVLQKIVEVID